MDRRRILLTNDDGIEAPGLQVLVEPLSELGEVVVVAPIEEQSGVSHSIVYRRAVHCEERTLAGGVRGYAVDAFPADCVKLAFDQLMDAKPDLVVSGINNGANIGAHIFYSGTVAAALEASMLGVRSIAVSREYAGEVDFIAAAALFMDLLRMLDPLDLGPAPMLNVNIPADTGGVKGVRWAVQSPGPMPDTYDADAADENGRRRFQMRVDAQPFNLEDATDRALLHQGYITITPLKCDFTCHDTLQRLSEQMERPPDGRNDE